MADSLYSFFLTGNGGTLFGDKTVSVAIPAEDFDALVAFAVRSNVRSRDLPLTVQKADLDLA